MWCRVPAAYRAGPILTAPRMATSGMRPDSALTNAGWAEYHGQERYLTRVRGGDGLRRPRRQGSLRKRQPSDVSRGHGMQGLTMDYALTLNAIARRAEAPYGAARYHPSRGPDPPPDAPSRSSRRARRLAAALQSLGVRPGDRVATPAGTTTGIRGIRAVPLLGAVLHALNLRLHADELAYIARHGGPGRPGGRVARPLLDSGSGRASRPYRPPHGDRAPPGAPDYARGRARRPDSRARARRARCCRHKSTGNHWPVEGRGLLAPGARAAPMTAMAGSRHQRGRSSP